MRSGGRAGRRLNLHGALDLETGVCTLVEGPRIDAETTVRLLDRRVARNPGKRCIHVILDNARYHHAASVRAWVAAQSGRINLVFLPPQAPDLNAIERLWGAMHRAVTHNRFYPEFDGFVAAILHFFAVDLPQNRDTLRDMISDNFHVIDPKKLRVLTYPEYTFRMLMENSGF